METCSTPIFKKTYFFSATPSYTSTFPFPTRFKRTPSTNNFNNSSPFPNRRNWVISAQFGQPSKRRNSLRKKLIEEQKVRLDTDSSNPSSITQYPFRISNEIEQFESNQNLGDLEQSSPEKSKLLENSVYVSKFEKWIDQYKKDTEFWGIGSSPVFTVFQGKDGKVERVSVSEDEILRRNAVEPLFYKQEGSEGNFVEVNSKISYANRLAREIEKGEYTLPTNSSIAKFVVSGQESGFVNGIRSVFLQQNKLPKFSRIGFAVVCSFFVFWLVKKVFTSDDNGVELTRQEKEMLRRKMKARMEKEKMEIGSVEVLPKVVEPVMKSCVRPQLNKEELVNSIKAKVSGNGLMLPDSLGNVNDETRNFNGKIQEIQEMARQARESERKDRGENENANEEFSSEMENLEKHKEKLMDTNATLELPLGDDLCTKENGSFVEEAPIDASEKSDSQISALNSKVEGPESGMQNSWDLKLRDTNAAIELPLRDDHCTKENGSFVEEAPIDASEKSDSQVSALTSKVEGPESGMQNSWDLNGRELVDKKDGVLSCDDQTLEPLCVDDPPTVDIEPLLEGAAVHPVESRSSQFPTSVSTVDCSEDGMKSQSDQNGGKSDHIHLMGIEEEVQYSNAPYDSNGSSTNVKPKIILTVKEAREYLSRKHDRGELGKEPIVTSPRLGSEPFEPSTNEEVYIESKQTMPDEKELYEPSVSDQESKAKSVINNWKTSAPIKTDSVGSASQSIASKTDDSNDTGENDEMDDFQKSGTSKRYDRNQKVTPVISKESWIEKNFHELEPLVKKIGDGFRENYAMAKDKVEELNLRGEIPTPGYEEDDGELEWMKDESLREIVFQVRENELMGRDPFYMVNDEDRQAFFTGLERKVENMTGQLSKLHEFIHSKIENLDYGADGISLYDTPEKVIPRWKGPTVDEVPGFLNKTVNRQKEFLDEETGISRPLKKNSEDTLGKSAEAANSNSVPSSTVHISRKVNGDASKKPKTVIDSSDGSSRAGKKRGKEYWQHTKKWSEEFLEVYNEEADPEIKSILKDMGKDLDRWITKKEIQETADLMSNIPKRKRRYIEKKLDKLKMQMETFGPQAVVSKYREYAEEEEDYLWWLDLPFVLCIELYTNEDGDQNVGFYSLEMAEDLELDPKPYHVIAFEDPGDSKSFCYIIQAHMEMLGKGNAFVVARPPKEVFREAKANGFSVTVIRKGELQLNVDQTLEEVEELINEIGSKVYHDKIAREHSVDMKSLMKGVFGSSKPVKRGRSRRIPKKLPRKKLPRRAPENTS